MNSMLPYRNPPGRTTPLIKGGRGGHWQVKSTGTADPIRIREKSIQNFIERYASI